MAATSFPPLLLTGALALLAACASASPSPTATPFPPTATQGPTATQRPTATPAPTATLEPTPTTSPTPTPSPAPTPLPASVVLPRETLPGGKLFPDGLYAVIKGEGSHYDVYDNAGTWLYSFSYVPWSDYIDARLFDVYDNAGTYLYSISYVPWSDYIGAHLYIGLYGVGLFTGNGLSAYFGITEVQVKLLFPTQSAAQDYHFQDALQIYGNGFYQLGLADGKYHGVLYDPSGKVVRVLYFPETAGSNWTLTVDADRGRTIVFAQLTQKNGAVLSQTVYYISSTGAILSESVFKGPFSMFSGLVGQKYFLGFESFDVYKDVRILSLYGADGNVLMTGVTQIAPLQLDQADRETQMYFYVSDYFSKDGIVYGADLLPVPKNTLDAFGKMIPGVAYDVQGIPCVARTDSLAVGFQGGRMAIKTPDGTHVFAAHAGESYFDRKGDRVLLLDASKGKLRAVSLATGNTLWTIDSAGEDSAGMVGDLIFLQKSRSTGTIRVVSLITGKTLYSFGTDVVLELADDYAIVHTNQIQGTGIIQGGFFILDGKGNVRYQSKTSMAHPTYGDFIVLQRGSYVGIADLNGDWVIKSLPWYLSHD